MLEYCKLGSLSTWLNECAREQRAVPLLNAVKIGKDLAAVTGYILTLRTISLEKISRLVEDDRLHFTVILTEPLALIEIKRMSRNMISDLLSSLKREKISIIST